MRKFIKLIALLLCFLTLAGCNNSFDTTLSETPDTQDTIKTSKIDSIPFSNGQLYAVACLGYEKAENLSVYIENYLDDDDIPTHYISNGEYYLIIPRYPDMTVRLYRNHLDTSERSLMYENTKSVPFLIRCNISDIFPDTTIELTYELETVEFSPYISLMDGNVVTGDSGLDITHLK